MPRSQSRKFAKCCHCSTEAFIYARRLCHHCYYNLAIRNRYGSKIPQRREWTRKEVNELKAMRNQIPRVPVKICAKRLNRNLPSTQNACHRFGLAVFKHKKEHRISMLKAVYDGKRNDEVIATMIGCSASAVFRMRNKLGLPSQPRGSGPRDKKVYMRCMACPAKSHMCRAKKDGWAVRPIPGHGLRVKEVYCPRCFAKYGWPQLELAL